MSLVTKLIPVHLDRNVNHTEVNATYSVVHVGDGTKCLQINTYGSATSKTPGKVSQAIRFSPDAIKQLGDIIQKEF